MYDTVHATGHSFHSRDFQIFNHSFQPVLKQNVTDVAKLGVRIVSLTSKQKMDKWMFCDTSLSQYLTDVTSLDHKFVKLYIQLKSQAPSKEVNNPNTFCMSTGKDCLKQ